MSEHQPLHLDEALLEAVRERIGPSASPAAFIEAAVHRHLAEGEPAMTGESAMSGESAMTGESEYLRGLQSITAALANAGDLEDVCAVVLSESGSQQSGDKAIWRLEGQRLLLVAGGERSREYPEIPLDDRFPARANLESGEALFVESREELLAHWPVLEAAPTSAFAGLPLVAEGRRLGLLAVGYDDDHRFSPVERDYLRAVAEQTAVAMERAELRQGRADAQLRRELLAEAMFEMSGSHSSAEVLLQRLAELAVPRFCNWCFVVLRQANRLELVASARDGAISDDAEEYLRSRPVRELLLAAGAPDNDVRVISAEPGDSTPGAQALLERLGLSSMIAVPLQSEGGGGLMLFGSAQGRSVFRNADLGLAASLAQRATVALEHHRVEQENRVFAETLTRAILPGRFPELEQLEFGAAFEPAGQGSVGGDWYDVFEWVGGRFAMVVGDVSGHGVTAAAAMARLRNGLLAFASEGHAPVAALARLAPLLDAPDAEGDGDLIATVKLATLDPETCAIEVANAGHPPLLLMRDGVVEFGPGGGTVLSSAFEPRISEFSLILEPGELVLFYTDGLIERPGEDYDESLARLARAALAIGEMADLNEFCRLLVEATAPANGRRDDCCVVALRVRRRP